MDKRWGSLPADQIIVKVGAAESVQDGDAEKVADGIDVVLDQGRVPYVLD